MNPPLAFEVTVPHSCAEAVTRVTAALQAEGFGVLTTIDVKATLQEKLGEDVPPYVILGACNPALAHRALASEPRVGLLLPCNVTVEAHENGARVSIINPEAMLSMEPLASNAAVCQVASEARQRLQRVAAALEEA